VVLGTVPGQVVDSMKAQPLLLAVMLVNLATVFGLFYVAVSVNSGRAELIARMIERCMPVDVQKGN
jgi:hypothetical protein